MKKNMALTIYFLFYLFSLGNVFGVENNMDDSKIIGEKIIFLPQSESYRELAYKNFSYKKNLWPKIKYKDLVGKIATVNKVEVVKNGYEVIVLKIENTNKIIYNDGSFCDTGFLSEMEKAKSLVGKTLWFNKTHKDTPIGIGLSNLEKVNISRVEWGSYGVLFFFKMQDGYEVSMERHSIDALRNQWYFEDPYKQHKNWDKKAWDAIKNCKIYIGMTQEMLLMSWGKPEDINKSVGSWGVHEQWVYGNTYVYLENGIITSWQN